MNDYEQEGRDAGKAAGSWIIDGSTTAEACKKILQGIADCDSEVMDMQPAPLSGEWAGESIGEIIDGYFEMSSEDAEEAANAYELGYSQGFWDEVERAARVQVA
jgi:hypothetical protein